MRSNIIEQQALKELRDSSEFKKNFSAGVSALKKSGVLDFLRKFSRPYIIEGGKDINQTAYSAAQANGFHEALDQIEHFDLLYLVPVRNGETPTMDFGGLNLARSRGHITDKDKI